MATEDKRREIAVSGWNACLALFSRRPEDIRRILVEGRKTKALGHVLSWAAKERLLYRIEPPEELARISGTTHHEGIVIIAREKRVANLFDLAAAPMPEDACVVALESVANPHNIGAILRTSAFFGVNGLVIGGEGSPDRLSPAVLRTSEGGAEEISVYRIEDLASAIVELKRKRFTVIGTDVFGKNVHATPRERGRRAILLGSERSGLSPRVRDLADRLVKIPGAGTVESLNVSVACGAFLALLAGRGEA